MKPTFSKEILEQLKKLASAATPGPWALEENSFASGTIIPELMVYSEGCIGKSEFYYLDDARHIAAFNPAVALALIERIEKLEGDLRSLSDQAEICVNKAKSLEDTCDDTYEKIDAARRTLEGDS